jgi:hypothetical protein
VAEVVVGRLGAGCNSSSAPAAGAVHAPSAEASRAALASIAALAPGPMLPAVHALVLELLDRHARCPIPSQEPSHPNHSRSVFSLLPASLPRRACCRYCRGGVVWVFGSRRWQPSAERGGTCEGCMVVTASSTPPAPLLVSFRLPVVRHAGYLCLSAECGQWLLSGFSLTRLLMTESCRCHRCFLPTRYRHASWWWAAHLACERAY